MKQLIVISAPSGAGKTTITKRILEKHQDKLTFSISATTRKMRDGERDGIDYYFLTKEDFQERIAKGDFIEYEQIFDNYYGTLKSEIERAKNQGKSLIFDIDVKGGLSIRKKFSSDSLLIFLVPPSLEVLRERLEKRGTESEEIIQKRLGRVDMEMKMAEEQFTSGATYDVFIVNDNLDVAIDLVESAIFD